MMRLHGGLMVPRRLTIVTNEGYQPQRNSKQVLITNEGYQPQRNSKQVLINTKNKISIISLSF